MSLSGFARRAVHRACPGLATLGERFIVRRERRDRVRGGHTFAVLKWTTPEPQQFTHQSIRRSAPSRRYVETRARRSATPCTLSARRRRSDPARLGFQPRADARAPSVPIDRRATASPRPDRRGHFKNKPLPRCDPVCINDRLTRHTRVQFADPAVKQTTRRGRRSPTACASRRRPRRTPRPRPWGLDRCRVSVRDCREQRHGAFPGAHGVQGHRGPLLAGLEEEIAIWAGTSTRTRLASRRRTTPRCSRRTCPRRWTFCPTSCRTLLPSRPTSSASAA